MDPTTRTSTAPAINFDGINWIGTEPLPRDQEQSHRLHEPTHMVNTIDPITGHDITDLASHPHLDDGILTIYFESELTRKAYVDTPIDHPVAKLPGAPSAEDDRGG